MIEEERIRKDKEKDYLAPFLARVGDPVKLDRNQMVEVAQVGVRYIVCMYCIEELNFKTLPSNN